jgi:DNA polymerase-1
MPGDAIPFASTRRLLLVDGYGLIYRAFYAIPHLANSQGQPTNAIYGFFKTLRKILRELTPSHAGVVMDAGEPEARLKQLPEYKAKRKPMPEPLRPQIQPISELVSLYGLQLLEIQGVEADDIIGTLVDRATQQNLPVTITTSDKDLMQLVTPSVEVLDPAFPDQRFDAAAVRTRYGVAPEQIVDFLSLVGDNVDNIAGVRGVGPKTAQSLLQKYGTIEETLRHLNDLKPQLAAALRAHTEQIEFNRKFMALDRNVPAPWPTDSLRRRAPDYAALQIFLQKWGFKNLQREIAQESGSQTTLELGL